LAPDPAPTILHHGTTLQRARAIEANGPDPDYREPGTGSLPAAEGFSTVIIDLLGASLSPDWTVEGLAEQLLAAIAGQRMEEGAGFVLEGDTLPDHQSRRLLRPLLACLAAKSAAEAGMPANLYGGQVCFKRGGPNGPVWILGRFENRPGCASVMLRRSNSPPETSEIRPRHAAACADAASKSEPSPPNQPLQM
jgi:hypothetical protein